jgi:hypothetical protein
MKQKYDEMNEKMSFLSKVNIFSNIFINLNNNLINFITNCLSNFYLIKILEIFHGPFY